MNHSRDLTAFAAAYGFAGLPDYAVDAAGLVARMSSLRALGFADRHIEAITDHAKKLAERSRRKNSEVYYSIFDAARSLFGQGRTPNEIAAMARHLTEGSNAFDLHNCAFGYCGLTAELTWNAAADSFAYAVRLTGFAFQDLQLSIKEEALSLARSLPTLKRGR